MSEKIPITIITGCLGSGKTTILNYLLQNTAHERFAVVVNEFGKAGVDHHLLSSSEEKISLVNSGCVCCNAREDLEEELKQLLFAHEQQTHIFDHIIIETTGLADPSPIVYTILHHPMLSNHFSIHLIITAVDIQNASIQMKRSPEFVKQLSASDRVVLTKADLVDDEEKIRIQTLVQSIQPLAHIVEARNGKTDIEALLQPLERTRPHSFFSAPTEPAASSVQSISFTFDQRIDWTAFTLWLSMLLHAHGENVLRVKGLLNTGEDFPVSLNGVQHLIHPPAHLNEWPTDAFESYLVFILRDINPQLIQQSLSVFQKYIGSDVELLEYREQIEGSLNN
ncbi:CobW family GTP-binding protein [Marinococcus halotolerans]|uniref:CobW family GTP-binding protein n=1 Tax=Marinococcus halotolerans TaxID=301092 RepID=UPI0003B7246F|nr:GTP-binding protein [Marinococcus halotolerans]